MKKWMWFVLVLLFSSPTLAAGCQNIFEENFSDFKLMRVSSDKTNFLDAASKLQKAFVVKNDLVITSSQVGALTCSYYVAKDGSYTAGYLKTANLVRNTVAQNLAGFWKNDSEDNKISVQKDLSFKADLSFRSGTSLNLGDLQGRFIRLGSIWRYKKSNSECEVKAIVVQNILLLSGGTGCGFGMNIAIEGIYRKSS